jgi:hypothetical protein
VLCDQDFFLFADAARRAVERYRSSASFTEKKAIRFRWQSMAMM